MNLQPELLDAIEANSGVSGRYLTMLADAIRDIKSLPENATNEDKRTLRNRFLAGDPFKARFWGTIDTEPEVDINEADVRGLKQQEAELIIAGRDYCRKVLLELVD